MKNVLPFLKLIPLHILLWVLVWLFFVYFFSYASSNFQFVIWFSTGLLPVTIAATYIFAYILVPKYLINKKYIPFSLYGLATIISSVYIILLINFIIFILLAKNNIGDMPLLTRNLVFVIILVYLVVGVVSFIQLLLHSYKTGNTNRALENSVLEAQLELKEKELYYLKEQVHPHFLFNTLNTIYGSALKASKDTPELILKLSTMLDYMLHQINKKQVPISEEIKYIESYIGLEQVRFRDTLKVVFEKVVTQELLVPPMLFMAFVENAFKHGAIVNGFMDVYISLKCDASSLMFLIKNTVKQKKNLTMGHGLGIENTKKRLDATFPDAYVLEVEENINYYEVNLTITFNL